MPNTFGAVLTTVSEALKKIQYCTLHAKVLSAGESLTVREKHVHPTDALSLIGLIQ